MTDDHATIVVGAPVDEKSFKHWQPRIGPAFRSFLERAKNLDASESERIRDETFAILEQCTDPASERSANTGLVIGYVQSGKTLSFTAVSALAKDNEYRVIILLAGTTNNLVNQSYNRINSDLQIDRDRQWLLISSNESDFAEASPSRIMSELGKFDRGRSTARTVLIVAMKHHTHLDRLAEIFGSIAIGGVPVLLIDDEGDQAGINTKAKKGDESATYAKIKKLRSCFPVHTYLLYTATPQAPLLVSRIDSLSPDFGAVLTPGKKYIGGKEFFVEGQDKYVRLIPSSEVLTDDFDDPRPPNSLKAALRDFFLGAAIGFKCGDSRNQKNRSMMIHPSIPKVDHMVYYRWVNSLKSHWLSVLQTSSHPSFEQLVGEFELSLEDLKKTYPSEFSVRVDLEFIIEAIESVYVIELNTRGKPKLPNIDWLRDYCFILVGGIGLDRGFTVEGLTVSYLPRSRGVGNADSIQQRARFFGYKQSYVGLCRIYLTEQNIRAFSEYVQHEEALRASIKEQMQKGRTLKEWRRTYILDPSLKPTRSSVINLELGSRLKRSSWISPRFPYLSQTFVERNRGVVDDLVSRFQFSEYFKDRWTAEQRIPYYSNKLDLQEILAFITEFRFEHPDDGYRFALLQLELACLCDINPDLKCIVMGFSGPWTGVNAFRTLEEGRDPAPIKNLFQGANSRTDYPGARKLVNTDSVTLHIYRYDLKEPTGRKIYKDVPVPTIHIPKKLAVNLWVEKQ